jgi:hypothetical protein
MRDRRSQFVGVFVGLVCAFACLTGVAAAAETTIGPDVSQPTTNSGTCGFEKSTERPCLFVNNLIYNAATKSPCDGTITHFRLNGFPRPLNEYSLRVVRQNPDGSYTGTATSAPVTIATEGVNEYATDLPIAAGEMLGIDFLDSLEEHGLRWVGTVGSLSAVLYQFPPDGQPAFADIPTTNFYYLFDADIQCAAPAPVPPATPIGAPAPAPTVAAPPSNSFKVLGLKQSTLSIELGSTGTVTATEVVPKAKPKAKGKKAAPRLLKPSSASGGPGIAALKLSLTGAAKAKLRATGKVKVHATLAFTPTGGTTATQLQTLTVKAKRHK